MEQEPVEFKSLREKVQQSLKDYEIRLDTDFKDQHFLVSENAINNLVDSAGIGGTDQVLEIGPGLGQITEKLGEKAAIVYAIEIDKRFQPALDRVSQNHENIMISYTDALNTPWPRVNKLVSSVPFSILEPFLKRLITEKKIKQSSLVIGRNFYLRATDPNNQFSRTGFFARTFFDIQLVRELDSADFFPQSGDKAVIISLKRQKCRDFGMSLLASRMLRCPNHTVYSIISDLINESFNRHKDDPMQIPTINSLGMSDVLLKKRLREINNSDINTLISVVQKFDRSGKSQRRKYNK